MRQWFYLLLSAACAFYGLSIFLLRSGSRFFLIWFLLGGGFLGLFLGARQGIWQKLPGAVKGGFLLLVLLAVLLTAACEFLVLTGFRRNREEKPEVILVLGAQMWPEGPSLSLKYRLDTALQVMQENPEVLCIVSGGQGYNEPCTEAEGMARYLSERGIAPERILQEDRSTNTVENIRFSMELTDLTAKKVGIITNNFHIFRSVGIARRQGLKEAFGIPAPSTPFYLPNNMFREVFGIVKDFLLFRSGG